MLQEMVQVRKKKRAPPPPKKSSPEPQLNVHAKSASVGSIDSGISGGNKDFGANKCHWLTVRTKWAYLFTVKELLKFTLLEQIAKSRKKFIDSRVESWVIKIL